MRWTRLACAAALATLVGGGVAATGSQERPAPAPVASGQPILTEQAFAELFKKVSNWGRWGADDQRGTLNLITTDKRKQAAAAVQSGISVSLAQPILEGPAPDIAWAFTKANKGNKLVFESVHGGWISHVDALCHMAYKGKVYNGLAREEVDGEQGCSKLGLEVYKDGIVTRGVLIDMPRLKGLPWLEPGTPVTIDDINAWEKKTGVKVLPGDAVFLRTGKWARRLALGPTKTGLGTTGPDAGWHWSVIEWFKARDVAIVADDGPNDVRPPGAEPAVGLPIHISAIAAMGAVVLDGQNLEAAADLAAKLNRYVFMMTAAPLVVVGGSGAPINVTAIF
jgi:kynurenine formamidase